MGNSFMGFNTLMCCLWVQCENAAGQTLAVMASCAPPTKWLCLPCVILVQRFVCTYTA